MTEIKKAMRSLSCSIQAYCDHVGSFHKENSSYIAAAAWEMEQCGLYFVKGRGDMEEPT